jgi:hypothetical protein
LAAQLVGRSRSKKSTGPISDRTLTPGWHDKDEVMLHAAFQLLADFMEQESPDKHIDWSRNAAHRRAWKEIRDLYQWWKKKRPARSSPLDNKKIANPPVRFEKIAGTKFHRLVMPDKKKYATYYQVLKQHARLEQKWRNEDQRNLHCLINIREFLWT